MVTVWWLAASLIHYSFLNSGETIISENYVLQIDEMHWKLQCLQPALVNRKVPVLLHDNPWPHPPNQHFKSWMNWAMKFCLIRHIHLTSLTNQLPLLQASWQLFVGKMLPQPAGGRKCFLRVCWILKHGFLCYRNKQAFLGKNILIVMVPILINKDVFEPCYNDLKFKVQNCNYFCTRLNITQLEALKKTL